MLVVQKFGGSSVADLSKIRLVAEQIKQSHDAGNDLVIVVSAMQGETDRLISLARQLSKLPEPRELDVLLATGEQTTIALLCILLQELGCPAVSYTGQQVKIITDSAYNKARIIDIQQENIRRDLQAGKVVVVAGFQGMDLEGNITTLGRGGSDTTAVALAAALQAVECQIYTDVDGVYTADPRIVNNACKLERISFAAMLELASLGAKVLQIRSVELAWRYNVPLRVLSTFSPGTGTLVTNEESVMEQREVTGIACNRYEARIALRGVSVDHGFISKVIGPLSAANIEVDMLTQNMTVAGQVDFSFTVNRADLARTMSVIESITNELQISDILVDDRAAKLSIIGVGMRSHVAVISKMLRAIADIEVNIHLISTAETKVSVILDEKHLEDSVRVLHEAFNLEQSVPFLTSVDGAQCLEKA